MKKTVIIVAIIILLGVVGGLVFNHYKKEEVVDNLVQNNVEKTVKDFGAQLQKVSLLAPEDILKESIQSQYSSFVSAELLNQWLAHPQKAPGRVVSSPWPDHIVVENIQKTQDQYQVQGFIVLMTSNEIEHGGEAGRQSVSLVLKNIDNKLLITNVEIGAPIVSNS